MNQFHLISAFFALIIHVVGSRGFSMPTQKDYLAEHHTLTF